MRAEPIPQETSWPAGRIRDLEDRIAEYEETLGAIRRGEIDALVVNGQAGEQHVYTLESDDRPYQVLIEQMQEGAFTLSDDGTILYSNRRVAEMFGVPQERVIGQRIRQFLVPDNVAVFVRLLHEAQRGAARGELTLCTASGETIPVYISLSLLRDRETTLMCGVLTDLREQKLHLRELAEANLRLVEEITERERVEATLRQAQKMDAVGHLAGGLAHDFNNLLTSIVGSLEMLRRGLDTGRLDKATRYIGLAQAAADRAAALTQRLLAFARRQLVDPVPTSSNRLIGRIEDLIRRTIGPAIDCDSILAADLWPTLCDPNQLENAILNLAINARDAMPDGGTLTIKTENVAVNPSLARKNDIVPGDFVVIRVTDTGTGMSPEVLERAFDPFFTTKPTGFGTGLGLSTIYGFARQSGGQAHIESEPGRGTTVHLYLPRHSIDEVSIVPGEEATTPRGSQSNNTVLLVEDEADIRVLVSDVLADHGYTTLQAEDGPSGLRIVESNARIDLLITDVGLPGGMNGRQVADAARARRPDLKVLFITGFAGNAAVGNARLEAGTQVMTKPFDLSALAARVGDMLARAD